MIKKKIKMIKSQIILKALLLVFIFLGTLEPLQAQLGTQSILPTDDARCEGGTSSSINYGSETSIRAKFTSESSSSYNRNSYIKFNLTGINTTNIGQVKLLLYPSLIQGSDYTINLYETSTNWNESTITFSNAPGFGQVINSFPSGTVNVWNEIDITSHVISKLTTSTEVSFGLYNTTMNNTNQILWNSKEASANKPNIQIVYKANKPKTFTTNIQTNNTVELKWDTIGCNASKYVIDKKVGGLEYVNIATINAGETPIFIDNTYNTEDSYVYRLTAINTGINAEPIEQKIIGTKPMQFKTAIYTKPYLGTVLPGTDNNPIVRIKINTENYNSALRLTSMLVGLTGTSSVNDLTGVSVFYTRADSNFVNPKPFGTVKKQPLNQEIEVTGNQTLLSGDSYFWICYSLSESAKFGNLLNAQCNRITINETESYVPTTTTATASREIDFLTKNKRLPTEVISSTTPYANTNLVSFSQNVIASYKGYQYAAYWNATKQVAVARKRIAGGTWEVAVLTDYTSANNITDNHYNISMGLCYTDGTIHLSFDQHARDLKYRKSIEGLINDPENFEWKSTNFSTIRNYLNGTTVVTQVTYPRFVTKPDGNLLLELRRGTSGNGDGFIWEYSGTTHNWTSIGKYIDGRSDGENAYLHGLQFDKNGVLHAAWNWRRTSAPETNHDLYYAYSEDNGRTWKNTNGLTVGTAGTKPLRMNTEGLKIWNIPENRSLMNQESMCVDNKGRVHILNGFIKDSEPNVAVWGTSYPVHFYRDEMGKWHRRFMLLESKKNRDQIACDANNNIYLILDKNIYMATEKSDWTDWKVVADKGNATQGEGAVDKERLLYENVLSIASGASPNTLVQINYLIDNLSTGNGNGLTIDYFNSIDFKNKAFTSNDAIDFSWENQSPANNVQATNFSARFYGTLETRFAEQYTLHITTSEKILCKIDGVLLINDWNNETTKEYEIVLPLKASHKYNIEIATAFTDNPAAIKLEWSSNRQTRTTVPRTALYLGEKESTLTKVKSTESKEDIIAIYPNPVKDILYFQLQTSNNEVAFVSLKNSLGQLLFTERFSNNDNQTKKSFDMSTLPKGLYLLNIQSRNEQFTKKIILE